MSSRFWDHIATLTAGQTARAGQVNAQFEQIEGAFDIVAAEMNRAIRFTDGNPAEVDLQNNATPAQRANLLMGFNAVGGFELRGGTFTWRSDWATTTTYSVNDVVRGPAANFLSLYVCASAHVSGVFATDLAAGRWLLMVDLTQLDQAVAKFAIITNAMSPFAAQPGGDYYVDVTSGAVTITLPASPTINGQPIRFCHAKGNIATNNLTVGRNGQLIMGLAEDMTVNTTGAAFELGFCDAASGWRLIRGT